MKKIAIIGTGLAGLTATKLLQNHANVTLFEKSRGVGGRLATRRAEPYQFDHGAQFFSARTAAFKDFIKPLLEEGVIEPWHVRFIEFDGSHFGNNRNWSNEHPHYVGTPSMNAFAKHIAQGLDIKRPIRIAAIGKQNQQWQLVDDGGNDQGVFDWVILATPAEQAADIIPTTLPCYQQIKQVEMQACFSLMLGFDKPLDLPFDAALVHNMDISWVSVNSAKPQRQTPTSLLINSTNKWADDHIDDNRDEIMAYLCEKTSHVIGQNASKASHKTVHGWRYANMPKQKGETHIFDATNNLALCGDYFIQGRVEAAFTSGYGLAQQLLPLCK